MKISNEQLKNKIQQLQGMEVSLSWKGYGSAIFLELGKLTEDLLRRPHHSQGEACISIEWDWRIEKESSILFGSSNSGPKIKEGLKQLIGQKIQRIETSGEIPELNVKFSGGYTIQSMAMVSGNPHWTIRQKNSTYLHWKNGNAYEIRGDERTFDESTVEKTEYMDLLNKIVNRIGRPVADPIIGNCAGCKYYFRIDGDFALLDYGVCVNELSKLDQRIVRTDSGCSVFSAEE